MGWFRARWSEKVIWNSSFCTWPVWGSLLCLILLGPHLAFMLMTSTMEVPSGGSQHLLFVQQEHIIMVQQIPHVWGGSATYVSYQLKKKYPLSYVFLKNMLCCYVWHSYVWYRKAVMVFRLYSWHATEIYIIMLFLCCSGLVFTSGLILR